MSRTHAKAAAGLLGLAFGGTTWAGGPPHPLLNCYDPAPYTEQARAAIVGAFTAQAQNGLVLDMTVWDHHFDVNQPTKLHRTGADAIDRAVRRHVEDGRPEVLHLFMQRAQDRAVPDDLGQPTAVTRRREMDEKRARAIAAYLAYAWPEVPYTLTVYDPRPVGINGEEALQGWLDHRQGARGSIPVEVLGGLSITPSKLVGGGPTGSPPPPVLRDSGTGGPSSLGGSGSGQ